MDRVSGVATAEAATWRDPNAEPPPRGCKLLILTRGGVAILGPWRPDIGHQAWAPLPKRPEWLRRLQCRPVPNRSDPGL